MEKFPSYPPQRNAAVLAKLDYYTCDFYETSMSWVLQEYLGLPFSVNDQFYREVFNDNRTAQDYTGFRYNCVSVSVSRRDLRQMQRNLRELDSDQLKFIMHQTYSKVHLEISGQGLTYLRSMGFDPEVEFRKLPELSDTAFSPAGDPLPKWHVTRVDFAFDFVNYMSDLYQSCYDYLYPIFVDCYQQGKSPRVSVCGHGSSYGFDLKTTVRTIDIGGRGGRQKCRIYDKLFETRCKKRELDPEELGGISDVKSWTRFEIEYGRDLASSVLYGHGDYLAVLKFAQGNFKFYNPDTRKPAPFWDEMYNWGEIGEFIQNAKWSEPVVTKEMVVAKAGDNLDDTAFILVYGWEAFCVLKQQVIDEMMMGTDRRSEYRRKKLLNNVQLLQDDILDSSKWRGGRFVRSYNPQFKRLLLDRFPDHMSMGEGLR